MVTNRTDLVVRDGSGVDEVVDAGEVPLGHDDYHYYCLYGYEY